ncbi:nucleoside monophosphate kinase [Streptomyces cinnamoneus]|uniref:nucleoside monophosphate kinase n=1 Tax=Streptomyces cinnamoneus TaxID=53446 RepID=UPI0033D03503
MSAGAVVALLGPPGCGKSTVSAALASEHALRVFRLREFAHQQARTNAVIADAVARTTDPLGWLPDQVAMALVRRAVDNEFRLEPGRPVLLEGYPGTQAQAIHLLLHLRFRPGIRFSVIELVADMETTARRIGQRQVCATCDTAHGGPRRPARALPGTSTCCASCGGELSRRPNDDGLVAAQRQIRYRLRAPAIRAALLPARVPWHPVDAGQSEEGVIRAAASAFDEAVRVTDLKGASL